MANDKAKCIVCGKEYEVCLHCKDVKEYRPWRIITDTLTCYKIHLILTDYNNKRMTQEQAKDALSKLTYNIDELKESVQAQIRGIIGENKKVEDEKKDEKDDSPENKKKPAFKSDFRRK